MDDRTYDIAYPHRRAFARAAPPSGAMARALVPASLVYRVAGRWVRWRAERRRTKIDLPVTVVSVGNLEVGGNGKTPLCMHLLERLRAEGNRVAYVSRGYRSRSERFDGVTAVTDEGGALEPGTRWLHRDHPDLSTEVGDEGAMVARSLPDVPIVFGREKSRALRVAAAWARDGFVVLDDAFQSWGVHRDVDVVLCDAGRPLGNGRLLPAGALREGPCALGRADIVIFNGATSEQEVSDAQALVRPHLRPDAIVAGLNRTVELVDVSGAPGGEIDGGVLLVSAIARPQGFEAAVSALGIDVVAALRYPDHHRFTTADVARVRETAVRRGCKVVVCTEKDWVKLEGSALEGLDARIAQLRVDVVGAGVLERIKKPRAVRPAVS